MTQVVNQLIRPLNKLWRSKKMNKLKKLNRALVLFRTKLKDFKPMGKWWMDSALNN